MLSTELAIACQPRSPRLHYPDQFRLGERYRIAVVEFKRMLDNNPQLKGRLTLTTLLLAVMTQHKTDML